MIFMIFAGFSQICRYNSYYFTLAYSPFDSLTALVGGGDMDLKSVEPLFGSLTKNFPDIQYIGLGLKNLTSLHNYSATENVQTITEILIFLVFLSFSIFFKSFKFHDISRTGKATVIVPGFSGAVGTLDGGSRLYL